MLMFNTTRKTSGPPSTGAVRGACYRTRVVDGGVTATGVLSRERGNLITVCITLY